MEITLVNFDKLNYAQLTELHKTVKNNLKDIDDNFEPIKNRKASELTQHDISLLKKHIALTQLRLKIVEKILAFADQVTLSEKI